MKIERASDRYAWEAVVGRALKGSIPVAVDVAAPAGRHGVSGPARFGES